MRDELKAAFFSGVFLADYGLCLSYERVDLLAVSIVVFVTILAASAKLEKVEKRLKLYKDDADRRGREEMDEADISDENEQPRIVMTRGKAS